MTNNSLYPFGYPSSALDACFSRPTRASGVGCGSSTHVFSDTQRQHTSRASDSALDAVQGRAVEMLCAWAGGRQPSAMVPTVTILERRVLAQSATGSWGGRTGRSSCCLTGFPKYAAISFQRLDQDSCSKKKNHQQGS